jgi:hypothetical protein
MLRYQGNRQKRQTRFNLTHVKQPLFLWGEC